MIKDVKTKPEDFFYVYNTSDFEIKSEGDDFYVSGFISTETVDENGDILDQQKLLTNLTDRSNPYAQYLSYKHKWLKGDKEDFSNALGVLQKAEIKENPLNGKPGVWAEYKLLKTSPYFDSAKYDIENRGVSGFSIEFKDAKRKPINIATRFANFLEDYVFGGVGIVARAAVKSAIIDGFYAKEYEITEEGVENMEGKEDAQVKTESVTEPVTEPVKAPEPVVDTPNTDELDKMKSELEAQKKELERLKIEHEKELVKQELENLKAKSKVLVETGIHKQEDVAPSTQPTQSIDPKETLKAEIKTILDDPKLSRYDKISRVLDKTFTQQKI